MALLGKKETQIAVFYGTNLKVVAQDNTNHVERTEKLDEDRCLLYAKLNCP